MWARVINYTKKARLINIKPHWLKPHEILLVNNSFLKIAISKSNFYL